MTLKHKLKLIPTKIQWFFMLLKDAHSTLELIRNKKALSILREAYWQKYIEIDRSDKSDIEGVKAKAKVEAIDDLIKITQ